MKTCSIEVLATVGDPIASKRLQEKLDAADRLKSHNHKVQAMVALAHVLLDKSDQLYDMSQGMDLNMREKLCLDINSMREKTQNLIAAAIASRQQSLIPN